MWSSHSVGMSPMESSLQLIVMAKRVPAMAGVCQHVSRLARQGTDGTSGSNVAPVCGLPRDASDRAARDGRHSLQQMTGLRVAMERPRYPANALGQLRRSFRDGPSDFRQRPFRHGRYRPGYHRQQFAGGHPDEW
jgi:hypothetical protein